MAEQYVPVELFRRTVKDLLDMIISARKEARLAIATAQMPPEATPEERQSVLKEIAEGFEQVRRKVAETPAPDVLAILRDFEGPIQ